MFTNSELLLKFLGKFMSTCVHSDTTKTIAIGTFYFVCMCCTNVGLGCNLSKDTFDTQEIAPV